MRCLSGPQLAVWDWWLVTGGVSSDRLGRHGRPGSDWRIQGYDLFYFDPADLSWDAGDDVIRLPWHVYGWGYAPRDGGGLRDS